MKKIISFIVCMLLFAAPVNAQPGMNADWVTISDWAALEVEKAIDAKLINTYLCNNFLSDITRAEFCAVCVDTIKQWYNKDKEHAFSDDVYEIDIIKSIISDKPEIKFDDCNDSNVILCARLGIVSGLGNNKFEPDKPIKRQEAARMLYNTLLIATPVVTNDHEKEVSFCCVPHSFDDGCDIQYWARDAVTEMYRRGVMMGVSDNNYNPNGTYTREQAYCTFWRLYNCYSGSEASKIVTDYYCFDNDVYDRYIYRENSEMQSFNPLYIDSNGIHYDKEQLGYIYPFDKKYAVVSNSIMMYHNYFIIDKNGNTMITNIETGNFYSAEVVHSLAIVELQSKYGTYRLFDLDNGMQLLSDAERFHILTDNLISFEISNKYGILDALTKKVIVEPKYEEIFDFYNGMVVARVKENNYAILKADGSEVKRFSVDKAWNFKYSMGTNMLFRYGKDKELLYRAYSGIKVSDYSYINFASTLNFHKDGEMIAHKNYHYYILNQDGSVKLDVGGLGYKNVSSIGCGLYIALKDNGESNLCDVISREGKIILTDSDRLNIVADKSGVFATAKGTNNPVITFYDFSGKKLSEYTAYGYTATGFMKYNTANMKFEKGLLYIDNLVSDADDIGVKLVLLPNGQIFDKRAC